MTHRLETKIYNIVPNGDSPIVRRAKRKGWRRLMFWHRDDFKSRPYNVWHTDKLVPAPRRADGTPIFPRGEPNFND